MVIWGMVYYCFTHIIHYLVGGLNPSENMKVSWDDYSQDMEK